MHAYSTFTCVVRPHRMAHSGSGFTSIPVGVVLPASQWEWLCSHPSGSGFASITVGVTLIPLGVALPASHCSGNGFTSMVINAVATLCYAFGGSVFGPPVLANNYV